jgi:DNA repair protein RecO (recombination protein O)
MLAKTRAIVLHPIRYGESSLIVHLYSEQYGRISCLAGGVRTKKPRFAATLFQPLTLLDLELYHKENRDIHRIKEANCPVHFSTIPFELRKTSIAFFIAEVLYKTLREETGNPALFEFLYHAILLLDTKDQGIASFHLVFLLHFSRFLGFFPSDLTDAEEMTGLPELKPFGTLSPEGRSTLFRLMHTSLAQTENTPLSQRMRELLLDRIVEFYDQQTANMGRLKSLQVLREVFSE